MKRVIVLAAAAVALTSCQSSPSGNVRLTEREQRERCYKNWSSYEDRRQCIKAFAGAQNRRVTTEVAATPARVPGYRDPNKWLEASRVLNQMANDSYRPMQPPRIVNTRCIQHPTGEIDCTSM